MLVTLHMFMQRIIILYYSIVQLQRWIFQQEYGIKENIYIMKLSLMNPMYQIS